MMLRNNLCFQHILVGDQMSPTVRSISFCLFLLCSCFLSPTKLFGQDEVLRIKSGLVLVPATITDRDGRNVTDLKKEEFQILEDGIEQEIAFFESEDQPIVVYFLVDVSSSMYFHKENLNIATQQMARRLRRQDQIRVLTFFQWTDSVVGPSEVGSITKWPTFDTLPLADCPGTYLYNAVDDALNRIAKIPGRKAIMLFTDGTGDGIGVSANDNYRKAEESGVTIYTFKFGVHPADPAPHTVSKKVYAERIKKIYSYMNGLAAKTGGRSYQIETISNVVETFGEVTSELSRQYRLGYYQKGDGPAHGKHDVKVKVTRPGVAIQSKKTYSVTDTKQ
jgi:Ca-activated chloride channel homolog